MNEDFGYGGDEFLIGDCMDDHISCAPSERFLKQCDEEDTKFGEEDAEEFVPAWMTEDAGLDCTEES